MKVAYKWMPLIDEDLCTGCGACVEACDPRSLALVQKVAVLARPSTCGSEEHCIDPCLEDAIHMARVPLNGNRSMGKWRMPA